MWNLKKPDLTASYADLDKIAEHSRSFSTSHIPAVKALYDLYDSQNGHVTATQHNTIPEDAKKGLRTGYDKTSGSGVHVNVRNELMSGVDKCPMCSVGNANTLDHYMEKGEYRALSMMRQNLVPMCRDCNTTRENNGLKSDDMLHAYYDKLPDNIQWLKVSLTYGYGAVSARFYPDPAVLTDATLLNKASKTIAGLGLNKTIGKELTSFLTSTLCGIDKSDIMLKTMLADKARSHQTNPNFGLNHWKTVILTELSSKSDLTTSDLESYL